MRPTILSVRGGLPCSILILLLIFLQTRADNQVPDSTDKGSPTQTEHNSSGDGDEAPEQADLIRDLRQVRTKYDPSYKWIGLGKRSSEQPRPKFGNTYRWIGLGKRGAKYSKTYKYIGLGKRNSEFVPVKYRPGYKWIGLGKRMAPYWSSQLLHKFKNVFGENEKAGNTRGTNMRLMRPVYSAVTKKTTPEDLEAGTIFSEEEIAPRSPATETPPTVSNYQFDGRPNARGGAFEPIYVGRYVGLGR